MAEEYTLTTPVSKGTISSYFIRKFEQYYEPPDKSWYQAMILSKTGPDFVTYYITDTPANANLASARIKAMNTMNFTTTSMQRRILGFASTDVNPATGQPFLPPGSVTGTPDV